MSPLGKGRTVSSEISLWARLLFLQGELIAVSLGRVVDFMWPWLSNATRVQGYRLQVSKRGVDCASIVVDLDGVDVLFCNFDMKRGNFDPGFRLKVGVAFIMIASGRDQIIHRCGVAVVRYFLVFHAKVVGVPFKGFKEQAHCNFNRSRGLVLRPGLRSWAVDERIGVVCFSEAVGVDRNLLGVLCRGLIREANGMRRNVIQVATCFI